MRFALVDANNIVVNVIELGLGADYTPPDGYTLVEGLDWPPADATPPIIKRKAVTSAGIIRFTVSAGIVTATADTIGISAVTRVSAGRYRIFYEADDAIIALLPSISIRDTADVRWRISNRTAQFTEIRVVNSAGSAVDVAEVIVTFDKVVST